MTAKQMDVVTGAFSFTGKYIAERLLADGRRVTTLTNHPNRATSFSDEIKVEPYRFDDPDALATSLEGTDTLYNTFWIRNPREGPPPGNAVRYSRRLVRSAEAANVRRIVHFSVSNADSSTLPYYQAKATVERLVEDAELSHAILQPTLVFGQDDLLINNLAWMLRQFPIFAVFGNGDYRVQPVFVGDVADIAVEQGASTVDHTVDVAGPDVLTFEEFIRLLVEHLSVRCYLVHTPPRLAHLGVRALEVLFRDNILTWDEARGLMDELLVTDTRPNGETRFSDWLSAHAHQLGIEYTSYHERYDPPSTSSSSS